MRSCLIDPLSAFGDCQRQTLQRPSSLELIVMSFAAGEFLFGA